MKNEMEMAEVEGKKEVYRPFDMAKRLIDFAKDHLGENCFNEYVNPEYRPAEDGVPVDLPNEYAHLVTDYPGKYFVVAYEDRTGDYHKAGTRSREVTLSTAKHRYDSNEAIREIRIVVPDHTNGDGNVIFLTVSDLVNENSYLDINRAKGDDIERPHGSAKVTYELSDIGIKNIREAHYNRLDESLFEWRGVNKPARWVRDLNIENAQDGVAVLNYKDLYLIGRDERGMTEEQADVRTEIKMRADEILSINIQIGLGFSPTPRIIFESEDGKIKIVEQLPDGKRAYANQIEIIKNDPNYSFIFENPVSQEKLMNFVRSRVMMLKEDWNKSQSVFSGNEIADVRPELTP